jgi:hypothetical protein
MTLTSCSERHWIALPYLLDLDQGFFHLDGLLPTRAPTPRGEGTNCTSYNETSFDSDRMIRSVSMQDRILQIDGSVENTQYHNNIGQSVDVVCYASE